MIKVENKTAPGIAAAVTKEQVVKFIEVMVEYYFRAGVLYATSDQGEGYLAFWEKTSQPALRHSLHMIIRFLRELPLKTCMTFARSSAGLCEKLFKKEKNYVMVSMVVVLKEFQGRGLMRKVLELPFSEAEKKGIYCILDTDTELKVKKYTRRGMEKVGEQKHPSGVTIYAMAYRKGDGHEK
ncbi:MAG: hypothetical protein NC084_06615 [Bacteroides sp.]|nr:N-acetyltransferase [Eubacterium sp.]MCM1418247.1 N-acetyltransferase [Roseburia sp.]MCM1462371.1 hypothetical protein [Bacteroides sp.]